MSRRRQADDLAINFDKLPGVKNPALTKAAAERQYAEEYPHVPRAEAAVDHREPDDSIVCPTCVGRGRVQRVEIRIGALLWRARQDKRLTQPQVAAELGVTQATISRLEREGDDRGGRRYARQLLRYVGFLGGRDPGGPTRGARGRSRSTRAEEARDSRQEAKG